MPPYFENDTKFTISSSSNYNRNIKTDSDDDYNGSYGHQENDSNSMKGDHSLKQSDVNEIRFVAVQPIVNNSATSFQDGGEHFSKCITRKRTSVKM